MNEFKIGSIVQLKSGGPVMTVSYIDNIYITVRWFESTKGHFEKEIFQKDMLKLIS